MKKKNYNYQWNINTPKPSKEKIDSFKDFDKVLQDYNNSPAKTPSHTSLLHRWYVALPVAAILVAILFYFGTNQNKNDRYATFAEFAATQPYVNPPLGEDFLTPFADHTFIAEDGATIPLQGGGKIEVPATAFQYGQGGIVRGEVKIRYRRYHDYVDFFLSGIPMEYDSLGKPYLLESAGMIEVFAEQNGERLSLAPDKSIAIELPAEISLDENGNIPNYNIYYLDTEQRNWVYEAPDRISPVDAPAGEVLAEIDSEDALQQKFQETLRSIETKQTEQLAAFKATLPPITKPLKPQKVNGSGQVFDFDFGDDQIDYDEEQLSKDAQEMLQADLKIHSLHKQYANTMWQVSPKNSNFSNAAVKEVIWDDMALKYLSGQDYQLTLNKGDKSLSFIVNPVLTAENYEKALASFMQEMNRYEQELKERKDFLERKKTELRAKAAEEARLAELDFKEKIAAYRAKGQDFKASEEIIKQKIMNSFSINRLGTWNCDRPFPPGAIMVKGSFKGSDNTAYTENIAYIVNKKRNSIQRFYILNKNNINLWNDSENLLWLVTKENKLAICPPENFEELKEKRKKSKSIKTRIPHTFVLNVVDKNIDSEEDIRKILDF